MTSFLRQGPFPMRPIRSLAAALLAAAICLPAHAELQGSAFTYQGRLEQAGVPVDGSRELRFRLFDAEVGGTAIGAEVVRPGQAIEDGVFTVPLDFGLLAFNGEARWLEIAVDGTTLAPRQLVTSAPYALYALDGAGASYTAGPGITIAGSQIAANIGTGPGTVAPGDGVIRDQYNGAQDADFWISGSARSSLLRADNTAGPSSMTWLLRLRGPSGEDGPLTDKLRVDTAGNLVVLSTLGYGILPASGAGERLMWHAFKSGFRAGGVSGTQWDDANFGFYSTAFGTNTTASAFATFAAGDGSSATAVGSTALGVGSVASGQGGVAAGVRAKCEGSFCAAFGYETEAKGLGSVAAGYRAKADADRTVALGSYVSTGTRTGSFIWGDGSTNTEASNTANNQFMVRAAGGVRLRTNATLTTGCDLPPGSGVFSCTSDRNTKRDFAPMDAEDVLLRVSLLPVQRWRYAGEPGHVQHVGPTAQDFRAAFGLGVDDVTIGLADIDGINMLAIQALAERTDALAERTRELDAVKKRLAELEAAVAELLAARAR